MKRCERSLDKKLNRRNNGASLVAQLVKNLPVIQESLDQFLVFRIPWRRDRIFTPVFWASLVESACSVGHLGSIPGLERSPEVDHGNPLQYSCLQNPHAHRSLAGYSPWGSESDTNEQLSTARCMRTRVLILIKSITLIMACGWGRGGKEVQEGGDIFILIFDSHCCMAESNTTL